jgi:hypothetical protein
MAIGPLSTSAESARRRARHRVLALLAVASLLPAGWAGADDAAARFALPEPMHAANAPARSASLVTYTTMTLAPEADASIPLRDAAGRDFGPKLSEGQFCELAAAGAAVIAGATYRVIGTARTPQAQCRRHFSRLARKMPVAAGALGRSVFARIDAPFGLGAHDYRLVPYRSVATSLFPLGATVFIPELRGAALDPTRRHDGYVFVADRLADAPPERIALFIGLDGTHFEAPVRIHALAVGLEAIADALSALHASGYDTAQPRGRSWRATTPSASSPRIPVLD